MSFQHEHGDKTDVNKCLPETVGYKVHFATNDMAADINNFGCGADRLNLPPAVHDWSCWRCGCIYVTIGIWTRWAALEWPVLKAAYNRSHPLIAFIMLHGKIWENSHFRRCSITTAPQSNRCALHQKTLKGNYGKNFFLENRKRKACPHFGLLGWHQWHEVMQTPIQNILCSVTLLDGWGYDNVDV